MSDDILVEEDLKSTPRRGVQIFYDMNGSHPGYPVFVEQSGKRIYGKDAATLIAKKNSVLNQRAKQRLRFKNVVKVAASTPAPVAAAPSMPSSGTNYSNNMSKKELENEIERVKVLRDVLSAQEQARLIKKIQELEAREEKARTDEESKRKWAEEIEFKKFNPKEPEEWAAYEAAKKSRERVASVKGLFFTSESKKIRREREQLEKKIKEYEKKQAAIESRKRWSARYQTVKSGVGSVAKGIGSAAKGTYSGLKSGVSYLRNKTRKAPAEANAEPVFASKKPSISAPIVTRKSLFSGIKNPFKSSGIITTTRKFRPGSVGSSPPPIPTPTTVLANSDPTPNVIRGGYRATRRNRDLLKRWRRGESIGFTATASLKAKGLIPRTSKKNFGKKVVSRKYR